MASTWPRFTTARNFSLGSHSFPRIQKSGKPLKHEIVPSATTGAGISFVPSPAHSQTGLPPATPLIAVDAPDPRQLAARVEAVDATASIALIHTIRCERGADDTSHGGGRGAGSANSQQALSAAAIGCWEQLSGRRPLRTYAPTSADSSVGRSTTIGCLPFTSACDPSGYPLEPRSVRHCNEVCSTDPRG